MYIKLDSQYEVKCTLGTIREIEKSYNKSFFELVNDIGKLKTDDQLRLLYLGVRRAHPELSESAFMEKCEEYMGIGDLMEYLEKFFYQLQYPGLSDEEVQKKIEKKLQQNQRLRESRGLIGKE